MPSTKVFRSPISRPWRRGGTSLHRIALIALEISP